MRGGNPRGVQLTELIVSIWILGLLVVFMFTIYPSASLAVKTVEHRLTASAIAQGVLEKKRLGPYAAIDVPPAKQAVTGADGMLYTIIYGTFTPSGADSARLRALRARVTWEEKREAKRKERSVEHEIWVYNIPK